MGASARETEAIPVAEPNRSSLLETEHSAFNGSINRLKKPS